MKGAMTSVKEAGAGFSGIIAFMANLKIMDLIFKPINAILKVFLTAIMIPLLPVLMPITEALMEMMPAFEKLGTLIGEGLAEIISLIVPMILMLMDAFVDELLPVLEEIIPIVMEFALILMEALMPTIMELLPPILQIVGLLARLFVVFMPLLIPIGRMIGFLMKLFLRFSFLLPILNLIITVLGPLLKFLSQLAWVLEKLMGKIPGFQAGTRDIGMEPTLAILHPHEAVLTATETRALALGKAGARGAGGGAQTFNIAVDLRNSVTAREDWLAEKIREVMWEEFG